MSTKLFTVEEANGLLPPVKRALKKLRQLRDAIRKLEEKKAVEQLSWLRPDGTVSPSAKKGVTAAQKAIEEKGRDFEKGLEELNGLGAQLKDLDEGLVDFFTARDEKMACLCWKEGEERIGFWHDLESGFAGRRPL
ncbi:MAG: DUF2203 domain-containing protein [Candidatus Omnitrophica bacterium]|nr:DUF2203 domain-containing protein [Candidatus Omnitrophota bacterium]